jgi:dienelactone hydrolase
LGFVLHTQAATASELPNPSFYPDKTNLLQYVDVNGTMQPVRTSQDWQRRRAHILDNMQRVMGPLPAQWARLPLNIQVIEEIHQPKFVRKKISYSVEPEDRLTAWLFVPQPLKSKMPAVLCLHQTTAVGKDEPAGLSGNSDLHYAKELAERGFITLAPDYWTFGDYRGKPYNPLTNGYASGTMKGIWNHKRSLDALESLPEVDKARFGCIGHSLGGHNALWLAAFDERIAVVVSSCGFNSFGSYAASLYAGGNLKNWAQDRYMPRITSEFGNDPLKVPFDWPEVLAAIAPRKVFINAPMNDNNFTVAGVKECVVAARPIFALLHARNHLIVEHPDAAHSFPESIRHAAYAFIAEALR